MKQIGPRVSIHWVKAILAAAESLGISTAEILDDIGVNTRLNKNEQPPYLSLEQTQEVWRRVEALSDDPNFGLVMGQRVRPSYFNVVSYVAMSSKDLQQAYENFIKFMPLISEAVNIDMNYDGQHIWIRLAANSNKSLFSRHQVESIIALIHTFSRWLVGEVIFPTSVHFSHSEGPNLLRYQEVFGLVPKFNQDFNGIQFSKKLFKLIPLEADAGLHALHKSHADKLLSAHQNVSWQAKVVQVIIDSGHYTMSRDYVAQRLNISTRTLQRRLQEEKTSFIELIDSQRKNKAADLLCKTQKSLKEVALELGFAEASTFYRACHRWFDSTPNVIREQGLEMKTEVS